MRVGQPADRAPPRGWPPSTTRRNRRRSTAFARAGEVEAAHLGEHAGVARVHGGRLLQQLQAPGRSSRARPCCAGIEPAAPGCRLQGFPGARRATPGKQRDLQRRRDRPRDVVLHGEDVVERAIVGLRPEVVAVRQLGQLHPDAHAGAGLRDAPFEHRADVHLLRRSCARRSRVPLRSRSTCRPRRGGRAAAPGCSPVPRSVRS